MPNCLAWKPHVLWAHKQALDISVNVVQAWPTWAKWFWGVLVAGACVNIIACFWVAFTRKLEKDDAVQRYQVLVRNAGVPYVLTNALRSFFPAWYPNYYVFWDHWLSSIGLHRSCAAVAEVLWVLQIAACVTFLEGQVYRTRFSSPPPACSWPSFTKWTSAVALLIICTAECFSFAGTVTQSFLWFTLEELCWGIAFGLLLPCFLRLLFSAAQLKRETGACWNTALTVAVVFSTFGLVYVPYMFAQDVPTYWSLYQDEVAANFQPNSLTEGIRKAFSHRVVTQDYEVWAPMVGFCLVYFIPGSWLSIMMMAAPRLSLEAGEEMTALKKVVPEDA